MSKLICKSSKGRREAGGKTHDLPEPLHAVLAKCSGQFVAEDLIAEQPPRERDAFAGALVELIDAGYLMAVAEFEDDEPEADATPVEAETADHLRAGLAARRGQRDDTVSEEMRAAEEAARKRAEERQAREAAEVEARRRAEERARMEAEERERQEAEAAARRAAEEREREEIRQRLQQRRAQQKGIAMRVAGALGALAVGIIILQEMPWDGRREAVAQLASGQLGAKVAIQRARLVLVSGPTWEFSGITVGDGDGAVRIEKAQLDSTLFGLFGAPKSMDGVRLSGVAVPQPALLRAWRGAGAGEAAGRFSATGVAIASPLLELPALAIDGQVAGGKLVEFAARSTATDAPRIAIDGKRDERAWSMQWTASEARLPFGAELPVADLVLQMRVAEHRAELSEFAFRVRDGLVKGKGILDWQQEWRSEGEFTVSRMDAAKLAPGWVRNSFVSGQGAYSARSDKPDTLLAQPRLAGSFETGIGYLLGVDLDKALQQRGLGGESRYDRLVGRFTVENDRIKLDDVVMTAGALRATGALDSPADGNVYGRLRAMVTAGSARLGASVGVQGTRTAPKYTP